MFSSESTKDDSKPVEEFSLPSLEGKQKGSSSKSLDFQPYDYGVLGGGPQDPQKLARLSDEILTEADIPHVVTGVPTMFSILFGSDQEPHD